MLFGGIVRERSVGGILNAARTAMSEIVLSAIFVAFSGGAVSPRSLVGPDSCTHHEGAYFKARAAKGCPDERRPI